MDKHPLIKYIQENQVIAGIVIIILGLILLEIRGILILFFISYIIMAAFIPIVNFYTKRGIPKTISIIITYLLMIALLVTLIFPLVPFFTSQLNSLANKFPEYLDSTSKILGFETDPKQIANIIDSEFANIGKNLLSVTSKIFGGIFSLFAAIVVSFYLLLNRENINNSIVSWFPKNHQTKTESTILQIEKKLGSWARGQLLLSLFVGALTGVSLTLLGMDFALPLAVIAGILEILPTIGPIIAAVPAFIVAFSISPTLAIVVVGVYILVQMVENHILVPNIMQKAVGLNPLIVILVVLIGTTLMGILGALLAVPFTSMILIIFNSLRSK